MIPKSVIKFYLVPGVIILVIIVIVLLIPLGKKKETIQTPLPTSQSPVDISITKAVSRPLTPASANKISPTLIPIPDFTGAEINQELPPDIKILGEQKTALRRLTPLTLPFAVISFDYENDMFIVLLSDPKDRSKIQFTAWRDQNYSALTEDKFVFK